MTDSADFVALSELLIGEPSLDTSLADAYRGRLTGAYPADLPRLLDAYRAAATQPDPAAALTAALNADTALARVCRETITVWYTAQFTRPDGSQDAPGTPAQYRSGLVWQVIQAHPISAAPVPGGYGSWSQHP
ncbi:sugar dehydrogenase complex small subunit [Streptomyces sp. H27-H1]|uniref:sugar dehydrogenase complex small subunit n=1 Tax=unclassified Streptomyces TaxID=2593676 RepID=UPI002271D693|nr:MULTISPECIES: sugar dehydrogenase complex small subunit [unclassified Streptomyces]MCY0929454.1 sugar dehydrogenase complex small subunit [Streptomyces sp. H27-H1]MCY0938330.1 sugar dehydrogenase complex small subunit [Streptomyces sp. H34-S4]